MKLYLHRNGVTCQRLLSRTPLSFVFFNLNEKFCWSRLFPAYSWLVCLRVCVCMCACMLHCLLLSCILFSVLVTALRWLHFKLDYRSQHDKSCKWCNDSIAICCKLNCFSMSPWFNSVCGSKHVLMFTDKCWHCADDLLYCMLCLKLFFVIHHFSGELDRLGLFFFSPTFLSHDFLTIKLNGEQDAATQRFVSLTAGKLSEFHGEWIVTACINTLVSCYILFFPSFSSSQQAPRVPPPISPLLLSSVEF